MNRTIVVPLEKAGEIEAAGGKAASLARLIRAGFRVPQGFVITTGSEMKMNSGLEAQILDKFDKMGVETVAVRSSAVAEDGKNDAWAGQFDTFLNIKRPELIETIKKCWGSTESERAKAYAKNKSIKSGAVAVIVQEMVPSDVAGVAFSVHPVTQNKSQAVIEAVRGLGEGLVSGKITPDTYVVAKDTFGFIESSLSGDKPILGESKLIDITQQIIKIEALYGFPVDVEWALANGRSYILQSRPITTLS